MLSDAAEVELRAGRRRRAKREHVGEEMRRGGARPVLGGCSEADAVALFFLSK